MGFIDVEVVMDLGSGLNYQKKGLRVLADILRELPAVQYHATCRAR